MTHRQAASESQSATNQPAASRLGQTASSAESAPIPADFCPPRRVAIVGVGLLGGSFGLAVRQHFPQAVVVGVSRSDSSRHQGLACGAVHEATADAAEACRGADLVVVATPVDRIAEIVIEAAQHAATDALLTDLGSTKASIVAAVQADRQAAGMFVGAHPIAGGEKTGAQHARSDLFAQRTTVVTPTDATDLDRLAKAQTLWRRLGSRVVTMAPEAHDRAVAATSHVPHLIAAILASLVDDASQPLIGSGWLGTTRVASGDPEMWTAICKENRAAVLEQLGRASDQLARFHEILRSADDEQLLALFQQAKQRRDRCLAL